MLKYFIIYFYLNALIMSKDIHKSAFDEGTKVKLSIFQDYLREWLPVFLAKKEIFWNTINIFDFFAGPGSDTSGMKGTPLIILDELAPYSDNIKKKNLKVNLYFNEFKKSKYDELKLRLKEVHSKENLYNIEINQRDFKDAFDKKYSMMENKNSVNLLFLDQNGIKKISEEVFKKILGLKRTDFLFFISSSTIKRFCEHPSFVQHIKLMPEEVEKTPYYRMHRLILDYYKSLIPKSKEYYLAPFSLKKESGAVYGLIFGSGHVLGIEKFLSTCWNIDPDRGEANFDIDDDNITPGQVELFTGEVRKPKKVDSFEKELRDAVLSKRIKTDKDIYLYTIASGFTQSHSRNLFNKLVAEKRVEKCVLNLSSKICKPDSKISEIKVL